MMNTACPCTKALKQAEHDCFAARRALYHQPRYTYDVETSQCSRVHTISSVPSPLPVPQCNFSSSTTGRVIRDPSFGHSVVDGDEVNQHTHSESNHQESTTYVLEPGFFAGAVQYVPNWDALTCTNSTRQDDQQGVFVGSSHEWIERWVHCDKWCWEQDYTACG